MAAGSLVTATSVAFDEVSETSAYIIEAFQLSKPAKLVVEAIGFSAWGATFNVVKLIDSAARGKDSADDLSLQAQWEYAAATLIFNNLVVVLLIRTFRAKILLADSTKEEQAGGAADEAEMKMQLFSHFIDLVCQTTTFLSMSALASALEASDPFPQNSAPAWSLIVLVVFFVLCVASVSHLKARTLRLAKSKEGKLERLTLEKYNNFFIGCAVYLLGSLATNAGLALSGRVAGDKQTGAAGFMWGFTLLMTLLTAAYLNWYDRHVKAAGSAAAGVANFDDAGAQEGLGRHYFHLLLYKTGLWVAAISLTRTVSLTIGVHKGKHVEEYFAAAAVQTLLAVACSFAIDKVIKLRIKDGIKERIMFYGDVAEVVNFGISFVVGIAWSSAFAAIVSSEVDKLHTQLVVSLAYTVALILAYAIIKAWMSQYTPQVLKEKLITIPKKQNGNQL